MRNETTDVPIKSQNYGSISMDASETKGGQFPLDAKEGKSTFNLLRRISTRILPKVSKEEKEPKRKSVSTFELFRFATWWDYMAIFLGMLFAALTGLCVPIGTILYGEFTTLLVDRVVMKGNSTPTFLLHWFGGGRVLKNETWEENKKALFEDSAAFGMSCATLSIVQFIFGVVCVDLFNYTALRQISRIRKKFFEAVMRQDMTWFDTNTQTNFASSITEDLEKLHNGIGEKVGIFVYLVSSFVFSVVIAFVYGWKLTLVIMSVAPIFVIAMAIVARVQSVLTEKELISYGSAGSCAEEVLASIRTVVAFGGEKKEVERFSERLVPAKKVAERKGMYTGIGGGVTWFIIYATYALSFWYGVTLILDNRDKEIKEYTAAVLIIVFFGVMSGAENMGLTAPHLEAFAVARGSASTIFSVIDRQPEIDSLSEEGLKRGFCKGQIDFRNIHFEYPARKGTKILRGLNLSINSGERVALVGSSGCGKSTLVQLVQRLYDPPVGSVYVDGVDIQDLNVAWLRTHIGVVGQEPVLFAASIYDNIVHGFPTATKADVEKAAMEANCHEFITRLPEGYGTMIGERGAQLSGGQKQRIAIARALVRKPAILLLDEATSALDLHSEAKVQKALDRASYMCTTLIVSHRLSTVRNVDRIVFIKDGVVAEMGNHAELMVKKGLYWKLVTADVVPEMPERRRKSIRIRSMRRPKEASDESEEVESSESSSTTTEGEESIEEEEKEQKVSIMRIMRMNAKEWPFTLVGSLAAVLVGASFPVFAIIFGEIYGILSIPDKAQVIKETLTFSQWFILVGVLTGLGAFFQTYMFNITGVRLTNRLRVASFTAMIRQEMAWFDHTKNNVGSLCARLSGDAASIQGATGTWIGAVLQAFSTFVIGILMSFYYSWKLTLVSLCSSPFVFMGVFFEAKLSEKQRVRQKQEIEKTAKIAVEAITNIRTVASLGREKYFIAKYCETVNNVTKAVRKAGRFRGVVFSFGQATPFFGYALSLYYGGHLVAWQDVNYKDVIKVSEALIFGAWMMGQALAFAPNFQAARISAGRIFKLLDRVPAIISPIVLDENKNWKCEGTINYSKIEFRYPTRPEQLILDGLDLSVYKGLKVALVGSSGCGKSTCIQLLQRLYDPDSGVVTLDGKDIGREMSLGLLRSQLGLVSQEPVLFDRTIADNIAYGDNSREVTLQEVQEAAKSANIHSFVTSLPLGYDTSLGNRGTQLSGGQKQRIAIARALLRDPRILLLDEATSALDNQSEQIVQAALDAACEGRTCIIIAHRLSTVRNADVICVLDAGRVAERGTHSELLAKGGLYSRLYNVNK